MFESARAASGASAVDRCEIITDHGPGEASDLLRGGLGGPGLGLDVLEDCAPSAALPHWLPASAVRGRSVDAGFRLQLLSLQGPSSRKTSQS